MVLEHADFVSEMVDAIEEDKKVVMDGLLHDLAGDRTAKKAQLVRSVFIVAVGGTIMCHWRCKLCCVDPHTPIHERCPQ